MTLILPFSFSLSLRAAIPLKAMLLEVWADLVKRFSAPSLAEAMLEELLKLHQGLLPFYLAPGDCALMVDIFQPLLADADATLCAAAKLSQALGSCVTQVGGEAFNG